MKVGDLDIGGNQYLATLTLCSSGILYYFTRKFAKQCVFRSYITEDKKRIGFQVHTMLGNLGEKFEVDIGNATFLSDHSKDTFNEEEKKNIFTKFTGSSFLPFRVKGLDKNFILSKTGTYFKDKVIYDYLARENQLSGISTREKRIQWRKTSHHHKQKKH